MKKCILLGTLFLMMCSCANKLIVQTSATSPRPINQTGNVLVFDDKSKLPENGCLIGNCYVTGGAFVPIEKCSYQACLDKTISEARSIGGNAVLIKQHRLPESSMCHSLMSDIYYIPENE